MKKQLFALTLSLVSVSSFAGAYGASINNAYDVKDAKRETTHYGPVVFSADVGVTSDLIDLGRSISDRNPSLYVEGAAKVQTKYGTFSAEYGVAKVHLGDTVKVNSRQDLFFSYGNSVGEFDFIAKVGERRLGGVHSRDGTTQNLILGATYKGMFVAVDKTISTTGNASFDTREKFGYTHTVSEVLSVTSAINFAQVGQRSVTKFDYSEISVDYAVTDRLMLTALATKGGRNLDGTKVPSQFGLSANYSF